MAKFTEEQKQKILTEIKRRRTTAMAAGIPALAGAFLLVMCMRRPGYHIGDLTGTPLLVTALVLLAIGMALYVRVWRCPNCNHYLGSRTNALSCPRCGALFTS